jgi:ABC-type phosphate transport system substrate-binding protein
MAAAIALTAAGAGAAPTPLYSGGATSIEKVFRDLFNAYGNTASGDLCFGRSICPTSQYNPSVEILFLGVGSGNGQKAIDANDSSLLIASSKVPDAVPVASTIDFGPYYGTGTGSTWVPAATGPFYPKLSFVADDNTLGSSDITAAAATTLGKNPLLQFPTLVEVVDVPFNPSANWKPKGAQPAGGSSKVQLSTNTLCGIFTGAITTWSDPAIKADNHGTQLGTGTITVVYRNDSAGATFLFTNALVNQCGVTAYTGTNGTVTAFSTNSTHPFPGKWLYDSAIFTYNANAPHYKSGTSLFINAFNAGDLPSNFYVSNGVGGVVGSSGMKTAILATPGSIGYISPDFVLPVNSAGPAAANLQTYASFSAGSTPVYRAPTAANGVPIMSSTKPPAFPTAALNPLNWGALDPLPPGAKTYPIGGFSFIDLRRCFASADDVAALAGKTTGQYGYFTWYFGSTSVNGGTPAAILAKNGFAPVPTAWAASITRLLTAPLTGLNVPHAGACKTIAHGA